MMATGTELRANQKKHLYTLLNLARINKGFQIEGLDEVINEAMAVMEAEDVAYVEKMIAKLP